MQPVEQFDSLYFLPIIVLLALFMVLFSFRFFIRLFIFFLVVTIIWYMLFLSGLLASPFAILAS